jgi:hypothetical protein
VHGLSKSVSFHKESCIFFEEEIVWSCASISQCECRLDSGVPETLNAFKRTRPDASQEELVHLIHEWPSIVQDYTKRKLTKESDRMPALSGLARLYAEHTSDEYFAGLWGNNIDYELLWISDHEEASEDPIKRIPGLSSPSWTWGSLMGPIKYVDLHRSQFERRSRTAEVKPMLNVLGGSVKSETSNPYGIFGKGVLVIVGQLLKVHYHPAKEIWRPYRQASAEPAPDFKTLVQESRARGGNNEQLFDNLVSSMRSALPELPEPHVEPQVVFDVISETPTVTEPQYYFLRAAQYIIGGVWTTPSRENFCLLLERTPNPILDQEFEDQVYERAGVVLYGFSSATVWSEEHTPTTRLCLI